MNFSLRATAAAVAACASAGGAMAAAAAGSAAAAVPTPSQVGAVEHAVSNMEVPYAIPLGTPFSALTGRASTARVTGEIPAAPLIAPAEELPEAHALVPQTILPELNTTHHMPAVDGDLPMVTGDGRLHDGALGLQLPDSPLNAKGPSLSLGRPLSYDRAARGGSVGLDDVAPTVRPPRLSSDPSGSLSLDERTSDASLTRPVDELRTGAEAALKQLGLGSGL